MDICGIKSLKTTASLLSRGMLAVCSNSIEGFIISKKKDPMASNGHE